MNQYSSTKTLRMILASGLMLFMLGAMLLGTTAAWFSDTITNSGNKIMAGSIQFGSGDNAAKGYTVDAEGVLSAAQGFENDGSTNQLIDFNGISAGKKGAAFISLKNDSTMNFNYKLRIRIDSIPGVAPPTDQAAVAYDNIMKYFWFQAVKIDDLPDSAITIANEPSPAVVTNVVPTEISEETFGAPFYIELLSGDVTPTEKDLFFRIDYGMYKTDAKYDGGAEVWTNASDIFEKEINFSIVVEANQIASQIQD